MLRKIRLALALTLTALASGRAASAQPAKPDAADPPTTPRSDMDPTWQDPARAADPPLLPSPAEAQPPTSSSGTDVAPAVRPSLPTPVVIGAAQNDAQRDARIAALEARLARDERRIRRLEDRVRLLKHLRFEGFIQPQLLVQSYNTAASPNLQADGQLPPGIDANDTIARPDGTTTNGTLFRLRRTRLRTFYETDITRFFLQIDVLPVGGIGPGIGTIVRNAEATGIARWSRDVRTEFTAGLFFTPFRAELQEASLNRPFIERTWFIQNAFPTERDIGVHAKTIAVDDRLVVDLGLVNGQRLGERTFVQLPDLNRTKDFFAYLTYRIGFVTLGMSGYVGRGQVVDAEALRFKQFGRWAVNYQATIKRRFLRRIGETRLISELAVAQNMDTGVIYPFAVPRIPTRITDDVANLDERAFYVRLEQDIGRMFTAGYRFDTYSPDTTIDENARDTHAFLAVVKFSPHLRWMNELDWAIDNVHPAGAPPPSKHLIIFSSVLQAMF